MPYVELGSDVEPETLYAGKQPCASLMQCPIALQVEAVQMEDWLFN